MENLFEYHKGYICAPIKKVNPLTIPLCIGGMLLMGITLLFGCLALGIALGRGDRLEAIFLEFPTVVLLTFFSLPIGFLLFLVYRSTRMKLKKEAVRRKAFVYVKEEEEYIAISCLMEEYSDGFVLRLEKSYPFFYRDIENVKEIDGYTYLYFEKSYIILKDFKRGECFER